MPNAMQHNLHMQDRILWSNLFFLKLVRFMEIDFRSQYTLSFIDFKQFPIEFLASKSIWSIFRNRLLATQDRCSKTSIENRKYSKICLRFYKTFFQRQECSSSWQNFVSNIGQKRCKSNAIRTFLARLHVYFTSKLSKTLNEPIS